MNIRYYQIIFGYQIYLDYQPSYKNMSLKNKKLNNYFIYNYKKAKLIQENDQQQVSYIKYNKH